MPGRPVVPLPPAGPGAFGALLTRPAPPFPARRGGATGRGERGHRSRGAGRAAGRALRRRPGTAPGDRRRRRPGGLPAADAADLGPEPPVDPTALAVADLGLHRRPQGGAAARLGPAGLGGRHPRPARRPRAAGCWRCPPHHVAGLQVLVRSLVAGTAPAVLDLAAGFDPAAFAAAAARRPPACRRYTSLVPTQLHRLLAAGGAPPAALRGFDAVLRRRRRDPAAAAGARPRGRRRGRHHLRHDRDVRRLRLRRRPARRRPRASSTTTGRILLGRPGRSPAATSAAPGPRRRGVRAATGVRTCARPTWALATAG